MLLREIIEGNDSGSVAAAVAALLAGCSCSAPTGSIQQNKKAGELDARQRVDFKFSIDELSRAIDPAGFEKYQKDKGTRVINDLENGITMKVLEADKSVQIHVFSSV